MQNAIAEGARAHESRQMIRWFMVTRFCTLFADQLIMAAVPLLIYGQTGSIAWSGLAYAVEWLPRVVTMPFMGSLVDSLKPRRQFLTSDASRLIIVTGMAFVSSPVLIMLGGA